MRMGMGPSHGGFPFLVAWLQGLFRICTGSSIHVPKMCTSFSPRPDGEAASVSMGMGPRKVLKGVSEFHRVSTHRRWTPCFAGCPSTIFPG